MSARIISTSICLTEDSPDIKFDNVFLGIPNGSDDFPAYCNPMLGDFGLIYDIMNPPGQLCGTIG